MSNFIPLSRVGGLTLSLAVLATVAPASAQTSPQWQANQMQGMWTNAAFGLVTRQVNGVGDLVVRAAGPTLGPPTPWSAARFGPATPTHPDYSMAALLEGFNSLLHGGPDATTIGFGGLSTGGDVCPPIDATGRLMLGNSWYFLSVSVGDSGTSHVYGQPGSALRSLAKPEQAIVTYYLEGSTGIDGTLANATIVEQTGAQLGYPPSSTVKVTGLDLGMGLISSDPNSSRSWLVAPVRDRLYFSLDETWLAQNPQFLIDSNGLGAFVPLDARTIYVMKWALDAAAATWTWSAPEIAFSSSELFGEDDGPHKAIDALSVYAPPDPSNVRRVVFSTTLASNSPDELLGFDRANSTLVAVPAQVLKTASHVRVSQRIGLNHAVSTDIDNVTGTCGGDPEAGVLSRMVGIPMSCDQGNHATPLSIATFRTKAPGVAGAPAVDLVHVAVGGVEVPDPTETVVHIEFGFPTPAAVTALTGKPDAWYTLGVAPIDRNRTTVEMAFPGDLGNLGPVSLRATLVSSGHDPVKRESWISVIEY